VLVALRKAGYSVTKVEDQNAPEALKARSSCRRDRGCHLPVPKLSRQEC
jgi:hypothetical protein